VYTTYLGGTVGEHGQAIAVDEAGHAYVGGSTASPDFPTTARAFQPLVPSENGEQDGFVAKLNRRGSALVYSTYLGGDREDVVFDIAIDRRGAVFATGFTRSLDFPTTADAFHRVHAGPDDPELRSDAFVTKLNRHGTAVEYSTYLGGNDQDGAESIAVDEAGHAHVTGVTGSTNFPTEDAFQPDLAGFFDGFVTRLNRRGSALVYSTYLGGSSEERGVAIAVNRGRTYVAGWTGSPDFPTTVGAFQTTNGATGGLSFVAKIGRAGMLIAQEH
jgi:hypothetical protein